MLPIALLSKKNLTSRLAFCQYQGCCVRYWPVQGRRALDPDSENLPVGTSKGASTQIAAAWDTWSLIMLLAPGFPAPERRVATFQAF
jgi:hypothetical protein